MSTKYTKSMLSNVPLLDLVKTRTRLVLILLIIFSLSYLSYGLLSTPGATAAGGDYSLDFSAARPGTYERLFPPQLPKPTGRVSDPLHDASHFDNVESLAPEMLALGQIVPFEVLIDVGGDADGIGDGLPANDCITFVAEWDKETTSADAFGYDPAYGVYTAFVDPSDGSSYGGDTDAYVNSISSSTTQSIRGTIEVCGLDAGEGVVVEIWLVLQNHIPPGTTGNVQSRLISATTSGEEESGEIINVGLQTVPLLRVKEFFDGEADVAVGKTDSEDPVGLESQFTYVITLTNNSDVLANGVVLRDTLDANTTFVNVLVTDIEGAVTICDHDGSPAGGEVICDPEFLNPSETVIITIVVDVLSSAPTDGAGGSGPCVGGEDLCNTVVVESITNDPNMSNNSDSEPTGVIINAIITIDKYWSGNADEDGSGDVTVGDTLTYTFDVANTGNVTLDPVTVTDSLLGMSPISCPATSLAPETAMSCTATYMVTQADVDGGGIANTATATGTDPKGNDATAQDSETVSISQKPKLLLKKTGVLAMAEVGESDVAEPGDLIKYTFTVTNDGNVTLNSVSVADPKVSPITCPNGNPLPSLAPGAAATCSGSYVLTQVDVDAGRVDNTATADSDETPPVTDDERVPIPQESELDMVKSLLGNADEDSSGGISLGDTLTYTFAVTNTGNVTLDPVTVTDPLPGMSPISCPATSLAPETAMSCTATHMVTQADVDACAITNTATATGTDRQGNEVSAEDSEEVPLECAPDIALDKYRSDYTDDDSSGGISLGDTLTYTFAVTNTGNVTLDPVTVTDPLPGMSPISCPATSLAPEKAMSCTATYMVTQADVDACAITNTATATGMDWQGNEVSAEDSEEVPLECAPDIALDKYRSDYTDDDSSGGILLGDTLTYTFAVTNTGNVTLDPVTVTDPLPGMSPISCPATSLAPEKAMSCTATYMVMQADVDACAITNTATATGMDRRGNEVSAEDSEEVLLECAPDIALDKYRSDYTDDDSSGGISLGDTLTYTFAVTNTGNVTLDPVTVTDPLPGMSPISCPATSLAPETAMSCTATYVVMQADVDACAITNTATATGTDRRGNEVSAEDSEEVLLECAPDIALDKYRSDYTDDDSSGGISLGDTLTYTFAVTNTGNVTLDPVTVTDPLPGMSPISCPATSLAPEKAMSCTATYMVTQADVDACAITNTATATGTDRRGNEVSAEDSEEVLLECVPDIALDKYRSDYTDDDSSGGISLGDTLTYTFAVTNTGNVTLDPVTVTDPLPGMSPISCPATSLAPEKAMSCTATYMVTQADVDACAITNTATATGTDRQGNEVSAEDSEEVPLECVPDIALDKYRSDYTDDDSSGGISLGDTLTYTFAVTNTGNVTLDPVTVTDPLPGMSPISCPATSLAPEKAMSCTATYVVMQADVDACAITNTATATGTDRRGNEVSAEDSEEVLLECAPDIALDKYRSDYTDDDGSGGISLGDTLTYTFAVTNTGNVTLDPVTVTDPLSGMSPISCPATSLAPEKAMSCTATYMVTQADVDACAITNTATATGTDRRGNEVSAEDSEEVLLECAPDIALDKYRSDYTDDDGSGGISLGDTLTYTFAVTNTGNVTLDPVTVTDPLPGMSPISCPATSLAPEKAMSCTATYMVTQADVDACAITNTATATGTDRQGNEVSAEDSEEVPLECVLEISGHKFLDINGNGQWDNPDEPPLEEWEIRLDDGSVTQTDAQGRYIFTVPISGTYTVSELCPAGWVQSAPELTNMATCGDATFTVEVNADFPEVTDLDFGNGMPDVEITKTCPTDVFLGEDIDYEIMVKNSGNVDLRDVEVNDLLTGTVDTISILGAGESATYNLSYNANGISVENTATVTGTFALSAVTASDSCATIVHELTVTKEATTSLERTYFWTIEKKTIGALSNHNFLPLIRVQTSGSQAVGAQVASSPSSTAGLDHDANLPIFMVPGQIYVPEYEVIVDSPSFTDENWTLTGTITIENPAPMETSLASVIDVVSPDIDVEVECESLEIPAEGSLVCTYGPLLLPDASFRTNMVTVTQNLNNEILQVYSDTADVDFDMAVVDEIDDWVNVFDPPDPQALKVLTATVHYSETPRTFKYDGTIIGPFFESDPEKPCDGQRKEFVNIAQLVTIDKKEEAKDDASVSVICVPTTSVASEDLPCDGSNDWDYNDIVIDVDILTDFSGLDLAKIVFTTTEQVRDSSLSHEFWMTPEALVCSGTYTLIRDGEVVSESLPYEPGDSFLVIADTFYEEVPHKSILTIEFDIPGEEACPFDISDFRPFTDMHGGGSFYRPSLVVKADPTYNIPSNEQCDPDPDISGDIRMIEIPDDWRWPCPDHKPIWKAYSESYVEKRLEPYAHPHFSPFWWQHPIDEQVYPKCSPLLEPLTVPFVETLLWTE